jgi:hypothetical protein
MNRPSVYAAVGIALSLIFLPACSASTRTCAPSPRLVSPFGALGTPAPRISLSANIRSQLPNFVAVRQVLHTHLSPQGEEVIIYDTSSDDDDPHPKLAFVTRERVTTILDADEASRAPGGFTRFQSACEFEAGPHQHAVAFAFTSAFDGGASAFAIIIWRSGHYQPVFALTVAQGQLVLTHGGFTLWRSEMTGTCVWCPSQYSTVRYAWRNGTFIKTSSLKRKTWFDPAFISGTPLRK